MGSRPIVQTVMAAAVALAAVGCGAGDPSKRNPCDPANRTADTLHHATDVFHLAVPDDATKVSFATNEGGMAYSLTLAFGTTPDGLARFLTGSGLPTPAPPTARNSSGQPLSAGTPKCGLDRGFTYSATVRLDQTYPDLWRSLAVDDSDPTAPRVLVVAAVV